MILFVSAVLLIVITVAFTLSVRPKDMPTPEPVSPVRHLEDRRAAIAHAVRHADARDVILIAGKGHEDYQEVMGVKHHFSDSEEAAAALAQRAGALPS